MSYDELLERFDRHLVRIDREVELTREEIRLSREAAARHAAMYERHAEMHERHTAVFEQHAAKFDDTREFIREMTVRVHRGSDALVTAIEDQREATREQTQAILKLLDRFDRPAGDPDSHTA